MNHRFMSLEIRKRKKRRKNEDVFICNTKFNDMIWQKNKTASLTFSFFLYFSMGAHTRKEKKKNREIEKLRTFDSAMVID
jgi:hypothetical protein